MGPSAPEAKRRMELVSEVRLIHNLSHIFTETFIRLWRQLPIFAKTAKPENCIKKCRHNIGRVARDQHVILALDLELTLPP